MSDNLGLGRGFKINILSEVFCGLAITITVMEVVLIQVFFFTVGFKQKNKNENTEYSGIFTPFKSEL